VLTDAQRGPLTAGAAQRLLEQAVALGELSEALAWLDDACRGGGWEALQQVVRATLAAVQRAGQVLTRAGEDAAP